MIKLAFTAEAPQDDYILGGAIAVLKKKAKLMATGGEKGLFEDGHEKAREYTVATGGGGELLELLDSIKQTPAELSDREPAQAAGKVETGKARAGDSEEPKYANIALRNRV